MVRGEISPRDSFFTETHVLRGVKKGLSVNDLGNYLRAGIRVVISVNSDKGLEL